MKTFFSGLAFLIGAALLIIGAQCSFMGLSSGLTGLIFLVFGVPTALLGIWILSFFSNTAPDASPDKE